MLLNAVTERAFFRVYVTVAMLVELEQKNNMAAKPLSSESQGIGRKSSILRPCGICMKTIHNLSYGM